MSALSDLIAQLESGGGASASKQPASMVDPVYGQYSKFVQQYGSGAVGVDNYAAQYLEANPQATVGDFYANYVLGTGSAANPQYNVASLQSQYPSAFSNLSTQLAAAGLTGSTPLASLNGAISVGSGGSTLTMGDPASLGGTFSSADSAAQYAALPGIESVSTGSDPLLAGSGSYSSGDTALQNWVNAGGGGLLTGPGNIFTGDPLGLGMAGGTSGDVLPGLFQQLGNWGTRIGIIIVGIVLVAAAAWGLVHGELPGPAVVKDVAHA